MGTVKRVNSSVLKEHKKASSLIPEMTEKEWGDFLKNVEENGIRKPLDVTTDYEILDGRHRLKAAKKLGIRMVEIMVHDLSESDAIKWVRDISIEQKILTTAQKHKIFTDADDFMESLYEAGKKAKKEGAVKGGEIKNKSAFGSEEPKAQHNTAKKVGKQIGASDTTVKRLNTIKKKSPELYTEVVQGEKSAKGAYMELHPPGNKEPKEKPIKKDNAAKKSETLYDFQNQEVSREEEKELLLHGNNETLRSYLNQISTFLGRINNLDEVITLRNDDEDFFANKIETINLLKDTIKKHYGGVTNE